MLVVLVQVVVREQPGGEAHEGADGAQLLERGGARAGVHPRQVLGRRRERLAHVLDHFYRLKMEPNVVKICLA